MEDPLHFANRGPVERQMVTSGCYLGLPWLAKYISMTAIQIVW